ncbi:hypothetical protein AB3X82_11355 [Paraburkholderia phenoliruptrix]|uniref:Uncharacterized protein n=1 Tax=Paraburkholderia phenoliruptrix TaxID=252970 RepID=A0ABV3WA99_9BURK|nr:hypothetical protein [Paraburkholderia phenoliruptrix]MDR6388108.1 hypothetical protein [Paraburkholderia phenoliruptrix]
MIEMMRATADRSSATQRVQRLHAPGSNRHINMRKAVGFAIVTSGFAVIAAQALQHALGG